MQINDNNDLNFIRYGNYVLFRINIGTLFELFIVQIAQ